MLGYDQVEAILQQIGTFLHYVCLRIMSVTLESTKVESPVALAVLCWYVSLRQGWQKVDVQPQKGRVKERPFQK